MWQEIILILTLIECRRLHARPTSAASFGSNFTVLFPSNNKYTNEKPKISITLMNPNIRQTLVKIKYAESFSRDLKEITVIVGSMSYQEVHFNDSLINSCQNATHENLVECADSRIYISSLKQPIAVLSHWYLPGAGDSFLVLPSSMATNRYALSAPAPAEDGITTIYFLPQSNNMTVNVVGEINEEPFNNSFSPKLDNGNLMTIQATSNLALIVSADAPFTVIVAVEKLPVSSDNNRTDFGVYMPTPLHDSGEIISDCYNVSDHHVAMLNDAKKFLVTQGNLLCDAEFTVLDEMEHSSIFSLTEPYNEVELVEYSQNAGFNSSSAVLQVLKYGYDNELINGSFLDLVVSWSQFVTDVTTLFVPSDQNIITIIGDAKATTTTVSGNPFPNELIWNWTPITFYHETFYYCTVSLPVGFYAIKSDGLYTVFVAGQIQGAAYGFVTAHNEQISKDLPQIKTTVQPKTTTEIPCKDV
ncbi:unnamed protein product [Cercopithifilaria johnstoni]|uniref:IgGFc-binding protein N-terminal domain-containing protein n=1 Tax=Cercopithifilaria johnstoni TaxID=2874296 RepID=A0A8J2Q6C5_9BILA|nr:unnamed protein product [Cercopithifilaria johnstoni]